MVTNLSQAELEAAWPHLSDKEKQDLEALLLSLPIPQIGLRDFVQEFWPVYLPKTELDWNWHLDLMCEVCTAVSLGEVQNVIVNIQPRHLKSSIFSVFWPVWEWTFKPYTRWLTSSYSSGLSTRDALASRRLIQSPQFQARFGSLFSITTDQNVKTRYDNTKQGYRIATSVGGANTGEGGDRVLVDDALKATDAFSQVRRDAANDWWDQEMSTRVNEPQSSAKVVVMQRLHEDDLTGHILSKMGRGGDKYELVCLQTEYNPGRPTQFQGVIVDPRKKPGELLFPTRFTKAVIDKLKTTLGSYGTASQLQQDPAPASGQVFQRKWFTFWEPMQASYGPARIDDGLGGLLACPVVKLPSQFWLELQSWDVAFEDKTTSSYVVGGVWGAADKYYLLAQKRDHLDVVETIQAVKDFAGQYPRALLKLVEAKANGPAILQTLRRGLPGMVGVMPKGSKVARAYSIQPVVESGALVLPHPSMCPWVLDYIHELVTFPASTNDDQVDQTTQAISRLEFERRRRGPSQDESSLGTPQNVLSGKPVKAPSQPIRGRFPAPRRR